MMDDKTLEEKAHAFAVRWGFQVGGQFEASLLPVLREVAEEARREELDFALRAAQSRELRVKALEAEVERLLGRIEFIDKMVDAGGVVANAHATRLAAEAEAEIERLRGLIEQADIEGWTVKGLKGAIAALRGEGEK